MTEPEKSRSMWANVDKAMGEMREVLVAQHMPIESANAFLSKLETLVTELVKAPPRGKSHPSRSKA